MIWPSFLAASIRAGVTGSGGGASASTRVESAAPASKPPVALSASRREIFLFFIEPLCRPVARARFLHQFALILFQPQSTSPCRQRVRLAARFQAELDS